MGGSLFGLLSIAQSGLAAQTAALDATGQNVSNVNTPGYSRVTANLETIKTPNGYDGGVDVSGMQRAFSALTFGSMLTEQGLGGAADARSTALSQVQSVIAPSTGSIGDNIDSFRPFRTDGRARRSHDSRAVDCVGRQQPVVAARRSRNPGREPDDDPEQ
jgi:flagellar hook-associated protein FlgK